MNGSLLFYVRFFFALVMVIQGMHSQAVAAERRAQIVPLKSPSARLSRKPSNKEKAKERTSKGPSVASFICEENHDLRALKRHLEDYEGRLRTANKKLSAKQRKKLWANRSVLGQGLTYFAPDLFWDSLIASRRNGRKCGRLYLEFKESLSLNDKKSAPIKLDNWLTCFRPLYGVHPSEALRLKKCVDQSIALIEKKQHK